MEKKRSLTKEEVDVLERANQLLFSDLSVHYNIDTLSQATGTSKIILKAIYRKAFGKNFNQFQHDVRLNKSVQLLLTTTLSIKEICFAIGYKNVSNFSEAFKKYYGYPPSKLRQDNSST